MAQPIWSLPSAPGIFDAPLELPVELWAERWLEAIDHDESGFPPLEPTSSAPVDIASDTGSSHSTPGSVGYLSFNSGAGLTWATPSSSPPAPPQQFREGPGAIQPTQTPGAVPFPPGPLSASGLAPAAGEEPQADHSKYKTRLCRNWTQTGKCSYGETCVYAHGLKEVRRREVNEAAVASLAKLMEQLGKPRAAAPPSRGRRRPAPNARAAPTRSAVILPAP